MARLTAKMRQYCFVFSDARVSQLVLCSTLKKQIVPARRVLGVDVFYITLYYKLLCERKTLSIQYWFGWNVLHPLKIQFTGKGPCFHCVIRVGGSRKNKSTAPCFSAVLFCTKYCLPFICLGLKVSENSPINVFFNFSIIVLLFIITL